MATSASTMVCPLLPINLTFLIDIDIKNLAPLLKIKIEEAVCRRELKLLHSGRKQKLFWLLENFDPGFDCARQNCFLQR